MSIMNTFLFYNEYHEQLTYFTMSIMNTYLFYNEYHEHLLILLIRYTLMYLFSVSFATHSISVLVFALLQHPPQRVTFRHCGMYCSLAGSCGME